MRRSTDSQIAIVAGLRTPFAKQATALQALSARDLGVLVCRELLERFELDPSWIEQVVFGQVVPSIANTNVAREIALRCGLPKEVDAYSVARACATSYQSVASVYEAIRGGAITCALAGGADSTSDVPIAVSPRLRSALLEARASKSIAGRLKAFARLRPADLRPRAPDLTEPTTGETMGESAERMAKENAIPRAAQDEYAHRSHLRAARAWEEGFFADQVMPVHLSAARAGRRPGPRRYDRTFERDNLVRPDSDLARYAELEPVFDRAHGSVTAGNSSPLSDGASALVLMRRDRAAALGLAVLGTVRSYAFAALDPAGQLLMGPCYATPVALERAGIELSDCHLIDMHEAFAAQVLSVIEAFGSKRFARERLGRDRPIGEIDPDKLNPNGGSIALGHPFAATGARQILQTLRELERRGGELALCTACAAGGLGAAMVLEAAA